MSNRLTEALEQNYFATVQVIKNEMEEECSHDFSDKFQKKMQKLLDGEDAETRRSVQVLSRRHKARIRWRKVLIAATVVILLMASTITATCLIKPQIYYDIQAQLSNWGITFSDEQGETINSGSEAGYFEPATPSVPQGFSMVDENKSRDNYQAIYENDEGQSIGFLQTLPDGAALNVDAEGEDIHEEFINGQHAIISHHGNNHTIVIENAQYVFVIDGNCDFELLREMAETL